MKERDQLQIINVPLMASILEMDKAAIWRTILDNLDYIASREQKNSACMFAYPRGMEHFEKIFNRFYDQDPDYVLQGLIDDLCFAESKVRVGFFSRDGYLNDISSADVQTSRDLLPKWSDDSDAWTFYREFDVLSAEHIDLMAASLNANRHLVATTDEYATELLALKTMSATLRSDPTLNAAYLYETNYY